MYTARRISGHHAAFGAIKQGFFLACGFAVRYGSFWVVVEACRCFFRSKDSETNSTGAGESVTARLASFLDSKHAAACFFVPFAD